MDLIFGETGKAFDEDTGLNNHWNRWFDVTLGQWINEDPIGLHGADTNLRRYVSNMSLSGIDPDGLRIDVQPRPPSVTKEEYELTVARFRLMLKKMQMIGGLPAAIATEMINSKDDYDIRINKVQPVHAAGPQDDDKGMTIYPDEDFQKGPSEAFPDGTQLDDNFPESYGGPAEEDVSTLTRDDIRRIVVICHEFGHTYFKFDDPMNVLLENMCRVEMCGWNPSRPCTRDDYNGMPIPDWKDIKPKFIEVIENFMGRHERQSSGSNAIMMTP